jgi:5-methyltetrahydrofolate--homocysteine methyltransferase
MAGMADLTELGLGVVMGDADRVCQLTQQALDDGVSAYILLSQGMIPAMNEVGRRFQANEFYVPELIMAARAMKMGMELLRPLLTESEIQGQGTMVLGTVWGDMHDVGKNLVGMMMEGAGYRVVDLGLSVSPESFVSAIEEEKAELVGISCLVTTTMLNMRRTIEALQEAGIRDQVKIMVGGAPVTQGFADEIGADGYAPDAASAVDLARMLLAEQSL